MKIFGAVLIVSGGYLLGKIRTIQWEKRYKKIKGIEETLSDFEGELREYRRSWSEYTNRRGISPNLDLEELQAEERETLEEALQRMQVATFRDSIEICTSALNYLQHCSKKLEEDITTTGKALPLVTGAIGLLVSILLF